jgi:diguanylate cyclase (GGDEF)-like protein
MITKSNLRNVVLLIVALIALQIVAVYSPAIFDHSINNYLGWHIFLEISSAVVSFMVFAMAWNNKNPSVSGITVTLGCAFLLVGGFDLMHTVSYIGMPDFITANSAQKHLTFWLFARFIAAGALFAAALRNWGPLPNFNVLSWVAYGNTILFGAGVSVLILYHSDLFPVWFTLIDGLSDNKKLIEYIIIVLHFLTACLFLGRMLTGDTRKTTLLLFAASSISGIGEIFFTFYTVIVGGYTTLGHIYKVIGYLFIYKALVSQAFEEPYDELADSHVRITQLVNYDELTGIPNKQLLKERVEQAIKMSERSEQSFALFFLDLDNFKNINDTMGHFAGDVLLKEVSARLQTTLRDCDTVARVGGDEFVILVQNVTHAGATVVAKNIIEAVAKPFTVSNNNLLTTPSIGIAIYWNDGRDFETLYQHADTAMYIAKNKGKNNFAFFTQDVQDKIERSMSVESHLRNAIANNELSLHYQPQISLITNELVGAEALLRWNSPILGSMSPGDFIPIAEKTGLISSIGTWVISTAIAQIKQWENMGLKTGTISINISAVQFNDPKLAEKILKEIADSDIKVSTLSVELTESVAMNIGTNVFNIMDKLHRNEISISIDDFGTGYSSLSVLKKFNISKIKIDQSFVRDLTASNDDAALVSAIINMATSLGFSTVAEGVETMEQAMILKKLGCTEIQGYLVSRPVPADKFEQLARQYEHNHVGLSTFNTL